MRKLLILIDDEKEIDADVTLRTVEKARAFIQFFGHVITHLMIDHDLGHDHDNGYKILTWMLEEERVFPPIIELVTYNPVGRKNMIQALIKNGYKQVGVNIFKYGIVYPRSDTA